MNRSKAQGVKKVREERKDLVKRRNEEMVHSGEELLDEDRCETQLLLA
jgi:hypothetical protein